MGSGPRRWIVPRSSTRPVTAIDVALREHAKAMRDEREAPDGIDVEPLARDALRELVGLGPLGPLLEDDEVHEIHVPRANRVLVARGGPMQIADTAFT